MESDVVTLQDVFLAKPPEEDSPAAGRTLALLSPLSARASSPTSSRRWPLGVALPPTFFEREDFVQARPAFAAGYGR